jgi:hypothetical protein
MVHALGKLLENAEIIQCYIEIADLNYTIELHDPIRELT